MLPLLLSVIVCNRAELQAALSMSSLYFGISVRDNATGKGVPLVLLRTGNYIEHYTDSAGNIAFLEPGLMNQSVWFSVLADGYAFLNSSSIPSPYDNGTVLHTGLGERATLYVHRTQAAQRVYRLTGGGRYRDTLLLGWEAEIPEAVRPDAAMDASGSGSFGQDTVHVATNRSGPGPPTVFWTFGDTACPRSARENNCLATGMYTVGATSCLPGSPGAEDRGSSGSNAQQCSAMDPPHLVYFAESGPGDFHHPRPMAPIPPLAENTWIAAVMALDDVSQNLTRIFASYYKNPGDGQGAGREGICVWDGVTESFVPHGALWPADANLSLNGVHTVQTLSPTDAGSGYVYFGNAGVVARVPANPTAVADYDEFEIVTASGKWVPAGRGASPGPSVERSPEGVAGVVPPAAWGSG
eukprot:Hpha_TRINITY_DN6626_c0_g1::TRINITY_DN6626_c0_g1_i1::g.26460::m.26460